MSKSTVSYRHQTHDGPMRNSPSSSNGVTFNLDNSDAVAGYMPARRQQNSGPRRTQMRSTSEALRSSLRDSDSDADRNQAVAPSPSASSTTSTSSSFSRNRTYKYPTGTTPPSSSMSLSDVHSTTGSTSSHSNSQAGTPVTRRPPSRTDSRVPSASNVLKGGRQEVPRTSSASPAAPQSRWQRLFSSFKKNRGASGTGPSHSSDSHCLKHSHNCSNSFLKAGISNMKGYKKANQDR